LRWWPRDWRASKTRALLTTAGRGIYLDLLFAQHLEPDCTLPDDERQLVALAGCTREEWEGCREDVLAAFPIVSPGRRQNGRMAHEWRQALEYRDAQRERGRSGGRASAKRRSTAAQAPVKRRSSLPSASASASASAGGRTPASADADAHAPDAVPTPAAGAVRTQDDAARLLARRLGSGLNVCRQQIRALVGEGWDVARIVAAIEAHSTAGLAPWDFTRAAKGTPNGKPRPDFHAAADRLTGLLGGTERLP
jgi:uncharacterized protein YdaU (DUF1376 family)